MPSDPAIRIEDIAATLGGRTVFDRVNLTVEAGEIIAIFGHNGAGKSTLLKCILGLVPLNRGTIQLNFTKWRSDPAFLVSEGVCCLPQSPKVFDYMTVEDNLRVIADAAGINRTSFNSRYAELTACFPLLKEARSALASRLSGGQAQQIAIARTFLAQPRLMLLDEPSIGLSSVVRAAVFDLISGAPTSFDTAVILVEHRIADALEIADRAYLLRDGTLVPWLDPASDTFHAQRIQGPVK